LCPGGKRKFIIYNDALHTKDALEKRLPWQINDMN
jgi:hypothetical protein